MCIPISSNNTASVIETEAGNIPNKKMSSEHSIAVHSSSIGKPDAGEDRQNQKSAKRPRMELGCDQPGQNQSLTKGHSFVSDLLQKKDELLVKSKEKWSQKYEALLDAFREAQRNSEENREAHAQQVETLNKTIETKCEENASLRKQADSMHYQFQRSEASLQNDVNGLKDQLDALASSKDREVGNWKRQVQRKEQELIDHRANSEAVARLNREKNAHLQSINLEKSSEIDRLSEDLRERDVLVKDLHRQIMERAADAGDLTARFTQVTAEYDKCKEQLDRSKLETRHQVIDLVELGRKLEIASRRLETSEQGVRSLRFRTTTLGKERDEAAGKLKSKTERYKLDLGAKDQELRNRACELNEAKITARKELAEREHELSLYRRDSMTLYRVIAAQEDNRRVYGCTIEDTDDEVNVCMCKMWASGDIKAVFAVFSETRKSSLTLVGALCSNASKDGKTDFLQQCDLTQCAWSDDQWDIKISIPVPNRARIVVHLRTFEDIEDIARWLKETLGCVYVKDGVEHWCPEEDAPTRTVTLEYEEEEILDYDPPQQVRDPDDVETTGVESLG